MLGSVEIEGLFGRVVLVAGPEALLHQMNGEALEF